MTRGFVSDIDGDDTVMESPQVTVSINLADLPPEQALAIAQEAGIEQQDSFLVGELIKGEDVTEDMNDAVFHVPLGPGLTALSQLGVVDLPTEPAELDAEEQA